jgi:hypothetical protein
MLALGIRQSFGLFLRPMSMDLGWGRETFSFAIALQNLVWGLAMPFAGAIADRHGAGRVIYPVSSAFYDHSLLADRVVMMTNGPRAIVGKILPITLPHPRSRKMLLEHSDYYALREELLDFLAHAGANNGHR